MEVLLSLIRIGNLEGVSYFLKNNQIDINSFSEVWDTQYDTPLTVASQFDRLDIVKLLLKNDALIELNKAGRTPLYMAVINQNIDICNYLINRGANINLQIGYWRYTLLIDACTYGYINIARLLISHNALLDLQNVNGYTALISSIKSPISDIKISISILLIKSGANLNIKDNYGNSIFSKVCHYISINIERHKMLLIAKMLVYRGVSISSISIDNDTMEILNKVKYDRLSSLIVKVPKDIIWYINEYFI